MLIVVVVVVRITGADIVAVRAGEEELENAGLELAIGELLVEVGVHGLEQLRQIDLQAGEVAAHCAPLQLGVEQLARLGEHARTIGHVDVDGVHRRRRCVAEIESLAHARDVVGERALEQVEEQVAGQFALVHNAVVGARALRGGRDGGRRGRRRGYCREVGARVLRGRGRG